jgi:hypothetical protein
LRKLKVYFEIVAKNVDVSQYDAVDVRSSFITTVKKKRKPLETEDLRHTKQTNVSPAPIVPKFKFLKKGEQ